MGGGICQYLEYWHAMTYIEAMNILGLILSFVLVGVVIGIALLLSRSKRVSSEAVRKFIHIGVSNWWFILIAAIDRAEIAMIGPLLFLAVNSIAVATGYANLLGIKDKVRNLGLIYFPLSLVVLVAAGYFGAVPLWACGMGCLTMGYGDGLAALLGKRYGKRRIVGGKTLLGTAVMFMATLLVVACFSIGYRIDSLWSASWWIGLVVIAAAASLMEAYTPFGLDNLTVPLGTASLAFLLLGGA